jgi:cytochrome c
MAMKQTPRWLSAAGWAVIGMAPEPVTAADLARGRDLFASSCAACHSLEPDRNMTGPSLYGLWGRKSGSLTSFGRYSPAMRSVGIVWSEFTLDRWIADPKALIPNNRMIFSGLPDHRARGDIIAFLRRASEPRAPSAQQDSAGIDTRVPNLKSVPPGSQVKEISYCGDTYTVTTADGQAIQFWERNLRFKTDMSPEGPRRGAPAIVEGGMIVDRASVIFAAPEEFGEFIKRHCQ